jgi:hypothetical protein
VILRVTTPDYRRVVIEASDGFRYQADLSSFESVHCFPRTKDDWDRVAVDSYGLGLVWTTRFEVHVDQVVGLASRREQLERTA